MTEADVAEKVDPAISIAVRFSDSFAPGVDIVKAHREVIEQKGAVWIAKFGQPIAPRRIDRLNKQCAEGIPTYLFMIIRQQRILNVYRGDVLELAKVIEDEHCPLVPDYYDNLESSKSVGFWVKVKKITRCKKGIVDSIRLSTGGSLGSALKSSMGNLFVIETPDLAGNHE